jgi:glucosamine-6-phosphate deaminase
VYDNHVPVNVTILPTPQAACARVADIIEALLAAKPDAVLALPAGNTPRPVYAELARRYHAQRLSFARATAFTLDEYAGLPPDHRQSFRRTLHEGLFRHVDLPFDSRTRVVDLADDTRAAAAATFGDEPAPARALTIGVATILAARRCVLLATGAAKADIVARVIREPPSPSLPASALQLHPDATFVLDAAAASKLA